MSSREAVLSARATARNEIWPQAASAREQAASGAIVILMRCVDWGQTAHL